VVKETVFQQTCGCPGVLPISLHYGKITDKSDEDGIKIYQEMAYSCGDCGAWILRLEKDAEHNKIPNGQDAGESPEGCKTLLQVEEGEEGAS